MARLNFNSDNAMMFIVNTNPASTQDEGSFELAWDKEGGRFAERLRELADWLDEHPEDVIDVGID